MGRLVTILRRKPLDSSSEWLEKYWRKRKRKQERLSLEICTGEKDKMLSEQTGGALGERVLFVLFCELSNLNEAERSQQGGMA